jgi:hypothetical protein
MLLCSIAVESVDRRSPAAHTVGGGAGVGAEVGAGVGAGVGSGVGIDVGTGIGAEVGNANPFEPQNDSRQPLEPR